MIPVSTLYDEYIYQPKLTEQKNPFEYIVPPLKRSRNKYVLYGLGNHFRIVSLKTGLSSEFGYQTKSHVILSKLHVILFRKFATDWFLFLKFCCGKFRLVYVSFNFVNCFLVISIKTGFICKFVSNCVLFTLRKRFLSDFCEN